MGLVVPWNVGSSQTEDWNHVSCTGRWILYHWTTRKALPILFSFPNRNFLLPTSLSWASQVALMVKSPSASAGDIRNAGSIPGLGRSPGGGHGSPFQYSCLENPMDRGTNGLQSTGSHRVGHDWSDVAHMHTLIQAYHLNVRLSEATDNVGFVL